MNNKKKKLSYLGPASTYSEEAALEYNKKRYQLVPKKTIFDVLDSVESSQIDKGIIPIENSRVGTILETIDFLVESKNLYINHEILLPIEACLITKNNDTALSNIKEIISKPEAINQCNLWIKKNLVKDIKLTEYPSTAEAVSDLINHDSSVAAIANSRSAEINNCTVLERGIQDYKNNIKGTKRSLFLYGDPGVGKTTIANILLKEYDFDVIEFNASEVRSQKLIRDKINEININFNFLTLCLITIICSICILYSLWFLISTTTIWFVKTWNATEVLRSFLYIGRFPLNSFSLSLRIFFSIFIPIAFITTIPSEVFLGLSQLWKILLEIIVAILFLFNSRRFWLFALKFYSSASS